MIALVHLFFLDNVVIIHKQNDQIKNKNLICHLPWSILSLATQVRVSKISIIK